MVSDSPSTSSREPWRAVLILVLMEYGLWRYVRDVPELFLIVLILVLMEYGLWRTLFLLNGTNNLVLILVLMEYGLWQVMIKRRVVHGQS